MTAELAAVDARLAREAAALRSLDPERERPSALTEVHAAVLARLPAHAAELLGQPLAEGLAQLALAELAAFPGNLFWDFDLPALALCQGVVAALDAGCSPAAARERLARRFSQASGLQHLYGQATPINFSYVHDFVYGFDWAKWLAREPSLHAAPPGPFSATFLDYMDRRGHELLELIAADDHKYPHLDEHEARNPFPFSREPEAEIRLHRELARRDLIPAPAWDMDALELDWSTRWRVPFQDRRVEVARELGLLVD
ncbi:ferrochelatase [Pseudenhygromyxa sp. WMMC2535]|uniref:ferrochelatase n=1 Tax=Pseudenhygromyxa sp. WMMC2535 TaxID=2712867 RepID=UPI001595F587|nr:ferrochelatase [Pseudenhygromyxa sp. WMMC2535]NVB37586.1 ferrochelatase [Pseudenhygromyxa sp. WMMC2535]